MKTRHLFAAALGCVGLLLSCSDNNVFDEPAVNLKSSAVSTIGSGVTVQWNQEQQNIDGFGIAQAGHANKLYSHHKRSEIMGWLYGDHGLRLNIHRGKVYNYFSNSRGQYDFALDRNLDVPFSDPIFQGLSSDAPQELREELMRRAQLWIVREAQQKYNVDKLVYSVWSPPAYMKSNGRASKGHLKLTEYQNYADFLVKFVKAYESYGLPVYAVSPANEPEFAAEWSSCLWLPGSTTVGNFISRNLGPTFQREGINSKIIFGENAQWSGILGFIMGSHDYVRDILNLKPNVANYDVIAAGHGYIDPVTRRYPAIIPFQKAMDKGIPVWLTEVSYVLQSGESYHYDIEDGLDWAANFHRYLSDASTSAIIWWLGATPGYGDEGLICMDMNDLETYALTKRYETFGNFSRYIKPNSRRVTIDRGNGLPADFHISSYKNGNELVIVMINKTDENVSTPLNINGLEGNVSNLKRSITDAENRWAESTVDRTDGNYVLDIPAKSAVTFIGTIE